MRALIVVGVAVSLLSCPLAFSQTIEINRQNRTIEVVVSERVQVEPDVAEITLGCVAYGRTHDEAYQANLQIADKVVKSLLSAGVLKSQIESSSIELSETNPGDVSGQPPDVRKVRQFKAAQSWHIRVAVSQAQGIIDRAVQAGANGVEDVSWDVADKESLEDKARTAAMEKARRTASEIAKSAGGKLGDLLYASNVVSGIMGLLSARTAETATASVGNAGNGFQTPVFSLQLFPQKVEEQATVRTVFALD